MNAFIEFLGFINQQLHTKSTPYALASHACQL